MKKPRVLTFNWHEGYIYLLAKTGFDFDVVELWKGGRFGWIKEFRPVPENCRLIPEEEGLNNLQLGKYDAVICHNTIDFSKVSEFPLKKIVVHHNNFFVETGIYDEKKRQETLKKLRDIYNDTKNLILVFVSPMKKEDWTLEGEVILPGIDLDEYSGYRGDIEKILRVGNGLKERDIMMGFTIQEKIVKGLPSTVLGLNPSIKNAVMPGGWNEYREYLKSHRLYLNTTVYPYEDGYNLAMLEAMATGMPVVSIANPSSPIEDGVNGYISEDEDYLHERIRELLNNPEKAKSLGKKARETVRELFPIERFIESWKRVIYDTATSLAPVVKKGETGSISKGEGLRIFMTYTSNPQTTGYYLERALRQKHDVITFGPSIVDPIWDKDILKEWKLEPIRERVRQHDIPYETENIDEVVERLQKESLWYPHLFFFVDTGIWYPLNGIERINCIKACYLIDVHLDIDRRIEVAKNFDYVFIAQRQYIDDFKRAGIERVFWLPLGCDPEIHGKRDVSKVYDVGFVGSLNDHKRIKMLEKISEKFNLHYERCFLEKMAEVYSKSKIVFNISVKNDLNMRVFEALCSGSMLITDEAKGSGLTELFKDREHLVVFKNEEELIQLIDYYLKNDEERERIAEAGRREVLKRHTYSHRADEIIRQIRCFEMDPKNIKHPTVNRLRPKNTVPDDYFRQERQDIEAIIPEGVTRILDVGCGEGILGKRLLNKGIKEVYGVEIEPTCCRIAETNLTGVICGDIEEIHLPFKEGYFDCIILADVLEHLREPLMVLKKLKKYLSNSGIIVASIPNIRYYRVIDMLVEGYWRYEDYGILDRTHLRFFTLKEIEKLFDDADLEITGLSYNIDPSYESISPQTRHISFGRISIRDLSPEELKDLFVFQYIIRAEDKRKINLLTEGESRENIKILKKEKLNLEKHLYIHPLDTEALYKHAQICYKLKLLNEATKSIDTLLIFEPNNEKAIDLRNKIKEYINVS